MFAETESVRLEYTILNDQERFQFGGDHTQIVKSSNHEPVRERSSIPCVLLNHPILSLFGDHERRLRGWDAFER